MSEWFVSPGYEPLRDAFIELSGSFGAGGGAYSAYVDGRQVVDLWGGRADAGRPWQSDTKAVIMSATKGFATLCLQILVDRGAVEVDAPVSTYWPEFGVNGKETTVIRHLLVHTSGSISFPGIHTVIRHDGTGWDDYEAIARGFAEAAPAYPPGTVHAYHALSIGWLIGEIVRRVDGRSLGVFFAEEVAKPLGLDTQIGTSADQLDRVARVLTTRTDHMPKVMQNFMEAYLAAARDPETLVGAAFLGDGSHSGIDHLEFLFNSPSVLMAEFPAGGATTTARSIARTWAMLAAGGSFEGKRILSEETVDAWGTVVSSAPDMMMVPIKVPRLVESMKSAPVPRTLGYLGNAPVPGQGSRFGPNPAAFGVEGLGCQWGFCDRQSNIAVGYVRSELALMDVIAPRLTTLLYQCARKLGHDVYVAQPKGFPKAQLDRALLGFIKKRIAVPARP